MTDRDKEREALTEAREHCRRACWLVNTDYAASTPLAHLESLLRDWLYATDAAYAVYVATEVLKDALMTLDSELGMVIADIDRETEAEREAVKAATTPEAVAN